MGKYKFLTEGRKENVIQFIRRRLEEEWVEGNYFGGYGELYRNTISTWFPNTGYHLETQCMLTPPTLKHTA
jgi:hypothetical protein